MPGWLAPVGVPAWLTFEFELNQIVSQVAVEYLTTYQNIGAAYCRLDGGELVRLDGLVADSRTSHERSVGSLSRNGFAATWARMVLKRCSSERGEREKHV